VVTKEVEIVVATAEAETVSQVQAVVTLTTVVVVTTARVDKVVALTEVVEAARVDQQKDNNRS